MRFRQRTFDIPVATCLLAGSVLAFCTLPKAFSNSKELLPYPPITFSVIATDAGGKLVEDLTAEDLKVVDNGVTQKDLSIRPAQSKAPFTLVLLFDLLNSSVQERGYMKQQFQSVLSERATGPLALYLLDATGKVYVVRAASTGSDHSTATQAFDQQDGTLLDRALEKAPLTGPADLRNRVVRTKVTYSALDDLCSAMRPVAGVKRLLWITYGIPSQIKMSSGMQDLTQFLLELGSRFNRAGTIVYSLDPGINISGGLINRDGLEVLTASTGGVALVSSDLRKAVAQARNDNAFNYLVEYAPLTRDSPDQYHTVRMTSRRKGIHLRTQQIYLPYAAK